MKPIYIVFLPLRVTLYQVEGGGTLSKGIEFPNHEEGRQKFSAWLQARKDTKFYIILDGFKETFHLENVPAIWLGDQKAIINRRFNQFSRDTVFRYTRRNTSWLSGFQSGRIQYLLSAIPEHAMIDEWLDIIDYYRSPIVGVYSISSLMGEYIYERDNFNLSPTILMCSDEGQGLRQFLFVRKTMVFYRFNSEPKEKWTREGLKNEMQRAARYFSMSFNVGINDLKFWYVSFDANDYKLPIFQSLAADKVQVFTASVLLNGEYGSGKSAVKNKRFANLSEFMVLWLAVSKKTNHYAPAARMYYKNLYDFIKVVKYIFLVSLIGALVFNLSVGWKILGLREQEKNIIERNAEIKKQAVALQRTPSEDKVNAILMNEVVAAYDMLANRPRVNKDLVKVERAINAISVPGVVYAESGASVESARDSSIYVDDVRWEIQDITKEKIYPWQVNIVIRGRVQLKDFGNTLTEFYERFQAELSKEFKVTHVDIPFEVKEKKKIFTGKVNKDDLKEFEIKFYYTENEP